jgi:VWFA-related protein
MQECTSLFALTPLLSSEESPRFIVDVNVVNVFATVRDKRQTIIRDLGRDDFILCEDSQPQSIRYFSQECDLPVTLGLVVDTSGSQFRIIGAERAASRRFLEQVLREDKDQAFVLRFDRDVDLIEEPTGSFSKLDAALQQLDQTDTPGWRARHPSERPADRYWGTAVFDAVKRASRDLMMRRTGRKALIVFSDGVDNARATAPLDAIASAQRANVLVYSVLFSDPQAYTGQLGNPRGAGITLLRRISRETGGSYFAVSNKQSMKGVFERIERDLRSEYSLGYVSDQTDAGPGYRKIRLTTRREGLIVQAREGYYAPA